MGRGDDGHLFTLPAKPQVRMRIGLASLRCRIADLTPSLAVLLYGLAESVNCNERRMIRAECEDFEPATYDGAKKCLL